MDENQTFKAALGYHLGCLSVTVCGLFLKRGTHATATTVLSNIHYTKFSHIIDHYYSRTILNITDNNDIVLSKVAATEFVDNMIANSRTG